MDRFMRALASGWLLLAMLALAHPSGAVDYATELVAKPGDPAPGTGGGTFSFAGAPLVNASGDVLFAGSVTGGSTTGGLFLLSGGVVSPLVLNGDAAPAAIGGTFDGLVTPSDRILADSGDVVFRSAVIGGSSAQGIFLASGGSVSPVVVLGDTAPSPPGGTFQGFMSAALNDAGDVVFGATANFVAGVFRKSGTTITPVFLSGDPAPDTGGATYNSVAFFRLGGGGDVATRASLSGGSAGGSGLFIDSGGVERAAVLFGDLAPAAVGGTFIGTDRMAMDGSDNTFFAAAISGGSAAYGIFRENGADESVVLLEGDPAPSASGGTYVGPTLSTLSGVNDPGDVGFLADLAGGLAPRGLFLRADGADTVVELVGHKAPGTGGFAYDDILTFTVSDLRQLAFEVLYDGVTRGAFLATPFELGSLAGLAGEVVYRESFEGETVFPTSPEIDVRSFGPMGPLVVGNGPPPAPTLGMGLASFQVSDTAGAIPFELAAVGLASAVVGPGSDAGISALFNELDVAGGGVAGVGLSMTTAGGSSFRADVIQGGASQLRLAETDPAGSVVDSTTTILSGLPSGPFVIELLVERDAATARALLRTKDGDVLTSPLALSSAVDETLTTFGPLAFVLNSSPDAIDVDVLALEVYSSALVPVLPVWGMGLVALALAGLGLRRLAVPRGRASSTD